MKFSPQMQFTMTGTSIFLEGHTWKSRGEYLNAIFEAMDLAPACEGRAAPEVQPSELVAAA